MSLQEKREELRLISVQATEIKEALLHAAKNDEEIHQVNALTINQIIVKEIYSDEKNKEFHTFKGWLKEGKAVKKGEKAFLIWGRPKEILEKEANAKKGVETTEETKEDTFFPVSYIFSNAQVAERTAKKND